MTPMAPMKSSTLSSFSVLVDTFLKYSPAFLPTIDSRIRGCSCAAGRAANTNPTIHRAVRAPAARLTRHETFISSTSVRVLEQRNTISDLRDPDCLGVGADVGAVLGREPSFFY